MPFDVADCDTETVMGQWNEVEIIAAGFICRISGGGDVETRYGRGSAIKLLLDLARQAELDITFLDV